MPIQSPLRDATAVVANLHRRYAGVSATVRALVPVQQRVRPTAVLDLGRLGLENQIGFFDLLRHGWRPPAGFSHRVWHARRATDMAVVLFLTRVLRQPWKCVYTSPTPRRHGRLWRALVNRADAIIAVTEQAASFLDWHTVVIPHGIDTDAFQPPPDKRAAWRESGLPGTYGIGLFGRIRPSKGTDLFATAMCDLLPRHPEFTAVITGYCKPEDRAFKVDIEHRIKAAGLEERIVFLGDLELDDIKLWYQRVALCVAPSRSEGFGLTPLEAMASGAAAVTSRAGGFERMIVPGTSGAIADTGDAAALTHAIEGLIADPKALLELGSRARKYVLEHHGIEREVSGIHAVYDEMLGLAHGR